LLQDPKVHALDLHDQKIFNHIVCQKYLDSSRVGFDEDCHDQTGKINLCMLKNILNFLISFLVPSELKNFSVANLNVGGEQTQVRLNIIQALFDILFVLLLTGKGSQLVRQ